MRHIHCRRYQEVGHNVARAKYIDVEVERGSAEEFTVPLALWMSHGLSTQFDFKSLRVDLNDSRPHTFLKQYETDCTWQSYRSYLGSIIVCQRSISYSLLRFPVL